MNLPPLEYPVFAYAHDDSPKLIWTFVALLSVFGFPLSHTPCPGCTGSRGSNTLHLLQEHL